MSSETAIEFAYSRYGRLIAPGRRTGWLGLAGLDPRDGRYYPGRRSMTAVFIPESGPAEVYGADYPQAGLKSLGEQGAGIQRIRAALFQGLPHPWVAVVFGKPAADPKHLVLNIPASAMTGYYDVRTGGPVFAYPTVLECISAGLAFPKSIHVGALLAATRRAREEGSKAAMGIYREVLEKFAARQALDVQTAASMIDAFLDSGMRPGLLGNYLDWVHAGRGTRDPSDQSSPVSAPGALAPPNGSEAGGESSSGSIPAAA